MPRCTARTLAATLIFTAAAFAQDEAASTDASLLDRVHRAYQQTDQYRATVAFGLEQKQERVTNIQRMDFYVVYDRAQQQLVVDKPDMRIVVKDGRLLMQSEQLPGHYLDAELPDPPTWGAIVAALPYINEPPLPDVVMLMADDPHAALAVPGGAIKVGDAPNTLIVTTDEGPMTLHVDPQTHLIDRAEVAVNTMGPGGPSMTLSYDYDVQQHNQPLDAGAFAFDTTNKQSAATLGELIQTAQAAARGGGGGHALSGQDAPAIDTVLASGEDFALADVEEPVIVLDFWATWCGPCREGLPLVQSVSDWAKENNKPVAVYTVNVGETPEQAKQFWQQQGFTMPIIMDPDTQISAAYGVQGIPQTVVIANGKVRRVHVGFVPTLADDLKSDIEAALEEMASAQTN